VVHRWEIKARAVTCLGSLATGLTTMGPCTPVPCWRCTKRAYGEKKNESLNSICKRVKNSSPCGKNVCVRRKETSSRQGTFHHIISSFYLTGWCVFYKKFIADWCADISIWEIYPNSHVIISWTLKQDGLQKIRATFGQ